MKSLTALPLLLMAASLAHADSFDVTFAVLAFAPDGSTDYQSALAPDYDYGLYGVELSFPYDTVEVWECAPGCQVFYSLPPLYPTHMPPHNPPPPRPSDTPEGPTLFMCAGGLLLLAGRLRRRYLA